MKKMLYILGDEIANVTGIQATVCRGMMRLTAEKVCDSINPMIIEAFIEKLDFFGWQNIINDPSFSQRLANMGIKNVPGVVAQAKRTLVERQSLFTLAAR